MVFWVDYREGHHRPETNSDTSMLSQARTPRTGIGHIMKVFREERNTRLERQECQDLIRHKCGKEGKESDKMSLF